jgi:tetratricopeptide (TPR) repeat protein
MECFKAALAVDPKNVEALIGFGVCSANQERLEEAIAWLDKALGLASADAKALALRGDLLARRGDFLGAARDFEQAAKTEPNDVDLKSGRASVFRWVAANAGMVQGRGEDRPQPSSVGDGLG